MHAHFKHTIPDRKARALTTESRIILSGFSIASRTAPVAERRHADMKQNILARIIELKDSAANLT